MNGKKLKNDTQLKKGNLYESNNIQTKCLIWQKFCIKTMEHKRTRTSFDSKISKEKKKTQKKNY